MSQYVVAYDIRQNRRRRRVARVLLSYGQRLQQSVYEVWLEADELRELRRELGALMSRDDILQIFPVDVHAPRQQISWQRPISYAPPVILLE